MEITITMRESDVVLVISLGSDFSVNFLLLLWGETSSTTCLIVP